MSPVTVLIAPLCQKWELYIKHGLKVDRQYCCDMSLCQQRNKQSINQSKSINHAR